MCVCTGIHKHTAVLEGQQEFVERMLWQALNIAASQDSLAHEEM